MSNLFLGIDLGTSSIKFAVQDSDDNFIYETSINYIHEKINEDWSEIDPNKWWELISDQLKIIFDFTWSENIVALAVTGQMHTTVFVDEEGFPIRKAIMWNDKRTKDKIINIKNLLSKNEMTKANAKIIATGSPLVNLLWLRENEPENFKKTYKFLIAKDFINYKLTGEFATDYCDASTSSLYDFNDENWSKEIMNIFELTADIYPNIYYSAKKLGVIKPVIKEKINIKHDIEVYVGTGDNAATYFASSESFESHDLLISIGTSGVVLIPANIKELSTTGKNIAFKLFPEDQYNIIQGSISTGGKSLSWWIEDILKTQDYNDEQNNIQKNTILEAEELFIPYLTGEKYIYNNNEFKGTFLNLTSSTSRKRITLSVLEGVSFAIKNLSDTITNKSYDEIKIIGGGAKSNLWKEIFASVYERSIKDYSSSANAVIGAIKISKAGYYGKHISNNNRYINITRGDDDLIKKYRKKYKNYLSAVATLNEYYQK